MQATASIERALLGADFARTRFLRALAPITTPFVRDRSLRVTAVGLASIALATACVAISPLAVLALGPLVLGVPHLASDLRYLVVRPGLHRRAAVVLACVAPLALMYATGALLPALFAPALVTLASRAPLSRRLALAAMWCALPAALLAWPWISALALVHLHNAVAVALWWAWRASRPRSQLAVPVAAALAVALAASGALSLGPDLAAAGPLSASFHLARLGAPSAVLVFALAQSIHYAVWLRLVPDDDRPRETPRTFVASFRALRMDLGAPLLAGLALVTVALWASAVFDLARAYDAYLYLARFHGPLELAVAALWIAEGRRVA